MKLVTVTVTLWAILFSFSILRENYLCDSHRTLFQDAVCKAPNNQRAHIALGMTYRKAGEPIPALDQFVRVLTEPERVVKDGQDTTRLSDIARNNIAAFMIDQGLYEDAVIMLDTALENSPALCASFINVALINEKTGHPQEALDIMNTLPLRCKRRR